jgi:tetratricopeptide (TPR) repeat protein
MPHILYSLKCFNELENGLSIQYMDSIVDQAWSLTSRQLVAQMVLDADIIGEKVIEEKSREFLEWLRLLLESPQYILLKAREFENILGIRYYGVRDYLGGVNAMKEFLAPIKKELHQRPELLDELTNAEIGVMQIILAEYFVTEVSADGDFEESLSLLHSWKPLNSEQPSRKEKNTLGILTQKLGKVYKDRGDWKEAENELRRFLELYAAKGQAHEGWAAGDLAHVLMEMGNQDDAKLILKRYLAPRQSVLGAGERAKDRRSDTTYLEMQLGECFLLQGRITEAEEMMEDLIQRFRSFGTLFHFEKFRVFFILSGLARLRHLNN